MNLNKFFKLLNITNLTDLTDGETKKTIKSYEEFISKQPHLSGVISKNMFGIFDKYDYSFSELTLNFYADKPVKPTDEKITVKVSDKLDEYVQFSFNSESMKLCFNEKDSISVSASNTGLVSIRFIFADDNCFLFINGQSAASYKYQLAKKIRSVRIDTTITRGLQFKIVKL